MALMSWRCSGQSFESNFLKELWMIVILIFCFWSLQPQNVFNFFLFFYQFWPHFSYKFVHLTLSWRNPLSYRKQSIDLRSKYVNELRHERVKKDLTNCSETKIIINSSKYLPSISESYCKFSYGIRLSFSQK